MKAILEFNLPEEKDSFTLANKSLDMYSTLQKIDNDCRGVLKYGEPSKEVSELASRIREIIYNNFDMDCVS